MILLSLPFQLPFASVIIFFYFFFLVGIYLLPLTRSCDFLKLQKKMATNVPFRDINVHASSTHYTFTSPSNPSAPSLIVDRPSGRCWLSGKPMLGGKRVTSISGILGIVSLRLGTSLCCTPSARDDCKWEMGTTNIKRFKNYLDKYIIVITKSTPVGRINGNLVYKIAATELLPLREGPLHVRSNFEKERYFFALRNLELKRE